MEFFLARLQCFGRQLAFRDVAEADGYMPICRFTDTKGVNLKPAIQFFGVMLETGRFTRQSYLALDLEPGRFVLGSQFTHALALGCNHSGLLLERRIDFQKAIIRGLFMLVENYLDDTETFIDRVE